MGRWWPIVAGIALMAAGLLHGCELGWDFLKEGGGGGNAGAQTGCQSNRVAIGQFPPSGGLSSGGEFTADYSSSFSNRSGPVPSDPPFGLRVSRNRLWLHDLSIELSFFPLTVDNPESDPRNGCLGRAILEINIPAEDLDDINNPNNPTIEIRRTSVSQVEPSALYAEGGDPGFTSDEVNGTISLRSTDGSRLEVSFSDLTFKSGTELRSFTNGRIVDDINQNPAVGGF
jgi:hypothetical protein